MSLVKQITTVAGVSMPVDEQWTVRRCRYAPEGGGQGRVCLATGIHGDELMGQLILFGVTHRVMENPDALTGTLDIYPMLNPLGLDVGSRMTPVSTHLDMNRAFPGTPEGTPLECMCYRIVQDMLGADLVLDIHASTRNKSELYEVRMGAKEAARLLPKARALCPELIWVYPDKQSFSASLTSSLCQAGTDALILEVDERRRRPQEITERVVEGIFCKLREMGIWQGETCEPPQGAIPTVYTQQDICRLACETPGMYVPRDFIGQRVREGEVLGTVIDAMQGIVREQITAPCDGLVFSQRSYSAVYPGTLIARIRKEQPGT